MAKYERFQQVVTYYLKSINANEDFLKLKINESSGSKKQKLQRKLNKISKDKNKALDVLDKIFVSETEAFKSVEEGLENIHEDVKSFVHKFISSEKV